MDGNEKAKNAIAERLRSMADKIERYADSYDLMREEQLHATANELDTLYQDARELLDAIADVNDRMDIIQRLMQGKPATEQSKGIQGVFTPSVSGVVTLTNGEKKEEKMQTTTVTEPAPEEVEIEADDDFDIGDPVAVVQKTKPTAKHACKKEAGCDHTCVIKPYKNEKFTGADAMTKKMKSENHADKYHDAKRRVASVIIKHNKAVSVGLIIAETGFAESYLNEFVPTCPFFKWTEGGYILTPEGNQTFRD